MVRVEELYPWPQQELDAILRRYPNVTELVWTQEEPKNMGAWTFAAPRLAFAIGTVMTLRYAGRPDRASPAEGYEASHKAEQARIIAEALAPVPAPATAKARPAPSSKSTKGRKASATR